MFGIGLAQAYGIYTIDIFGGTSAALLYALITRFFVGVGWYFLFKKSGKHPLLAFAPIVGPYTAFRLVWDDFGFAALFGTTTFIAFTYGIGVSHPLVNACSYFNFFLWWILAILTKRAYQLNVVLTIIYGGIPWLGVPLSGLWPSSGYKGAWSSDPEDEQNLTAKERKKRRKKAEKEARRRAEETKKSK